MLVSILVLMDTLLQQKLGKMLLSYSDEVSILVLMDTLLQLINNKFNNVLEDKGFNPCFNGYTTSTRYGIWRNLFKFVWFQSLF